MCWDAITLINTDFSDTLSLDYVTPKIVKGFMGAVIKDHDVPQKYRVTKRKCLIQYLLTLYSLVVY